MPANGPTRILIVRADRIGDVILSTPAIEALAQAFPDAQISFLAQANVGPLLRGLPGLSEVLVYDPRVRHAGWKGFLQLVRELRVGRFSVAVTLQAPFRVAFAVSLAGIGTRVGPLSKLWSWVLFNRGIRQRRSKVEMHEAEYNLQLLEALGIRPGGAKLRTRVQVSGAAREAASEFLRQAGGSGGKWIAVHPGMGGSALNWPKEHYTELIRSLIREGRSVLITGGSSDRAQIAGIREALGEDASRAHWFEAVASKGVDFLAALYEKCSLVVAPSTGPLHVAVAVGTPVVTFYPPIRVQSPKRWGPYPPGEVPSSVLVPEVECGEDFSCRGERCRYYPCMDRISVSKALDEIHRQLGSA